jgi:uncharacterized repeat protein (TIGR03806 family)
MYTSFLKYLLLLTSVTIFVSSCLNITKNSHPSEINFSKLPFKTLSEYGFYNGQMSDLKPNSRILKYEPIATLFSDYSFKKRFIYIPEGTKATVNLKDVDEPFNFPDKTIIIKNFYYPTDFRKPDAEKQIIETRLLVKINNKWEAYPYRWNKEQTDAEYKVTGGIVDVNWTDENGENKAIKYAIPNKNQCKSCHNRNGTFMPIGLKLKQLNHEMVFDQKPENQLDKWSEMGFINRIEDKNTIQNLVSINDPNATIDQKARSYLDVNCGHCHSNSAPAASSGLRLNYEENDSYHWGVKKSPVAAGMGAGSFKYDIYPGKGNESILVYRMASTHPGVMMPEIGRVSVHKEGVQLIKKWIDGLALK